MKKRKEEERRGGGALQGLDTLSREHLWANVVLMLVLDRHSVYSKIRCFLPDTQ